MGKLVQSEFETRMPLLVGLSEMTLALSLLRATAFAAPLVKEKEPKEVAYLFAQTFIIVRKKTSSIAFLGIWREELQAGRA